MKKLTMKSLLSAVLAAGGQAEDIKVISKPRVTKKSNVAMSTKPGWRGYPGEAKRRGRVKYRAKKSRLALLEWAKRRQNRVRFKVRMVERLTNKKRIEYLKKRSA